MIKQTLKVGTHRGNKRVWMQGKNLIKAGFQVGALYTTKITDNNEILLVIAHSGYTGTSRKVSKKKAGGVLIPVIDMNSKAISKVFEGLDSCHITFGSDCIIITKTFEDMITGPSVRTMIELGYLSDPTINKEGV